MEHGNDSLKSRKTYQAPAITRISLRPEESVLGHCKSTTVSGPVGATYNSAGVGCMNVGS